MLLSSLFGFASSAFGPLTLYNSIEGITLNLNGYIIQPYLSVQYQNISYGNFNTYVTENNVYTYQYYTGGSASGCASQRTMKLFIDCNSVTSLGPISEPSSCNYQGILEIPQACGISFAVGNELVSVTPSPSRNASATAITINPIDGYIGMILGAVGVSGVGIIIAIQVYNSMKNKGGLAALFKANSSQIDKVIEKLPVSDSVKRGVKTFAERHVEKIDAEIDKKLKSVRSKISIIEGKPHIETVEVEVPEIVKKVTKTKTPEVAELDKEPVSAEILKPETVIISQEDLLDFQKFLLLRTQFAAISK